MTMDDLARQIEELREIRSGERARGAEIDAEVAELRRRVAILQRQLAVLYSHLGLLLPDDQR
jgi:hypothetical protein